MIDKTFRATALPEVVGVRAESACQVYTRFTFYKLALRIGGNFLRFAENGSKKLFFDLLLTRFNDLENRLDHVKPLHIIQFKLSTPGGSRRSPRKLAG